MAGCAEVAGEVVGARELAFTGLTDDFVAGGRGSGGGGACGGWLRPFGVVGADMRGGSGTRSLNSRHLRRVHRVSRGRTV